MPDMVWKATTTIAIRHAIVAAKNVTIRPTWPEKPSRPRTFWTDDILLWFGSAGDATVGARHSKRYARLPCGGGTAATVGGVTISPVGAGMRRRMLRRSGLGGAHRGSGRRG